ncbi:MAG: hypothetical protein AAGG01_21465, partial [Planctomycetota bacterium]
MILAALLATFAPTPALALPPQSSDRIEVLLKENDPAPGFPSGWRVHQFIGRTIGADGGWAATVDLRGGGFTTAIVGQRPGATDGPVELLLHELPTGAAPEDLIVGGRMAGGHIAYALARHTWLNPFHSIWIDDTRIAQIGDAIDGRPGASWNRMLGVNSLAADGSAVVHGLIQDTPQVGGLKRMLWRWPEREIMLTEDDAIPGVSSTIRHFRQPFAFSPDSRQWALVVVFEDDSREGLIRGGELLQYAPGAVALEGAVIPPAFVDGNVGLTWEDFHALTINDRGHVAFVGRTLLNGQSRYALVRNGRPYSFTTSEPKLADMDERSGVLTVGGPLRYEGSVVLASDPAVDLDRDGTIDPEYSATSVSELSTFMARDTHELIMFRPIYDAAGEVNFAVTRARRARIDESVCNALLNSTGRPAELVASGSALAVDNEVTLHAFGLPNASRGYTLFSQAFGITTHPGG